MLSTNQTWLVQIVATKSKTVHCTLIQGIYSRLYDTTPTYIKQTEKDLNWEIGDFDNPGGIWTTGLMKLLHFQPPVSDSVGFQASTWVYTVG